MAIYHLKMTAIKRGAGRSATAAAAYRAGESITDERTGLVHDYTRKSGVLEIGMMGWSGDRQALWNAAEKAEKHPRAIVGREIVIALPAELTDDHRRRLVLDFSAYLQRRHNTAVDWAIHMPPARSPHNWHAHVMMTTREVMPDRRSLGAKTRDLDVIDTGADHLRHWRRTWADLVNDQLQRAGLTAVVDHRSHRAAGRDAKPQEHLGPILTAIEDRGGITAAGERNRARKKRDRQQRAIDRDLRLVRRAIREISYQASGFIRAVVDLVEPEPPQRSR